MSSNRMRTGIILCVLFAVAYGAYAWMNPAAGPITEAGSLGVNVNRSGDRGQTTAGGNPQGFKGSDEELQAVTGN